MDKIKNKRQNQIKRLVRQIQKQEKEIGISPWAKLKVDFSVLIKLPNSLSKKISCAKNEYLFYRIWDNIGERLHYITDSTIKYNSALNLLDAPLYLYNYDEFKESENLNKL